MYELTKRVLRKLRLLPESWPPGYGEVERRIFQAVRPYTLTDRRRVLALIEAVRYVARARIDGDIVECGVYKGGSMMAAALTLKELDETDRRLCLFDTFEGMPPPTERDVEITGTVAANEYARHKSGSGWFLAPLEEVRRNMESTGYPAERIRYVKGRVEETLPGQAPEKIALLRLDTDFYESTKHEMTHLYPRLATGGVLIVDDYLWWRGSREAVDEYIREHNLPLFLCPVEGGGVVGVKIE